MKKKSTRSSKKSVRTTGLEVSTETFLSDFFAEVPARVWVKDETGKYVFVNRGCEDDFRMPKSQWLGKTDADLFPQMATGVMNNDRQVLETGTPLKNTELANRRHRVEFVFTLRFPMTIAGHKYIAGVGIEITREILALEGMRVQNEQLFRSERLRAIGELTSGLAHDLNNNLNSVVLRLNVIKASATREQVPQFVALERLIRDSAARVRRVTDYAHSQYPAEKEKVGLPEVIRDALEMVEYSIERVPTLRGGRIRIDRRGIPLSLPQVWGWRSELRHLFVNLFMNARDAMPDGGTIAIEARPEGENVIVSVSDTGSGIAPEHLARIFDPFFTTKPNNTGLGLSMARDLMRRVGGQIEAQNLEPGGARFTLTFQIAVEQVTQSKVTKLRKPGD